MSEASAVKSEVDGEHLSPSTVLSQAEHHFFKELATPPASPSKKNNPKAKASPKKTAHKKTDVKQSIIGEASGSEPLKASHPRVILELLEIALNAVTAEQRCQVANSHGIVPNLLHMVRL